VIPLALPRRSEVDTREDQRQLGRGHLDRHRVAGSTWELERAAFQSLVPDCQPVAVVPIEDLEPIAASIHEQEEMTRRWILAEGGGHQARKRIEAFAEIVGGSVEEHPDWMR